jgi:hypothetical protein
VGGHPKFTLNATSGFRNAHPPFNYFPIQGFLSFFLSFISVAALDSPRIAQIHPAFFPMEYDSEPWTRQIVIL